MNNAIFTTSDICTLNQSDLDSLVKKSYNSDNFRYRYCLHQSHTDLIQEMVIAITSSSYVQPHIHPEKLTESYHIMKGELLVIFFNDDGSIKSKVTMTPEGTSILRMNKPVWHSIISISDHSIYHETLTGPFNKDLVVEYASWAPKENENFREYREGLKSNER